MAYSGSNGEGRLVDEGYRLPPERSLRLYVRLARVALHAGFEGIGLAQAAMSNVLDAIARLQEHHVRREDGQALIEYVMIAALVAVVSLAALGVLHHSITGVLNHTSNSLACPYGALADGTCAPAP